MNKLTNENYLYSYLQFQKRQAGVNVVFSPSDNRYYYNAYCLETELLEMLLSVEFEFLEDAIELINTDFTTWELKNFDVKKKDCGSCSAKRS
ncbi:MAG: hypothetical protein R3B45_00610 [Bdellovibrionota bacterium]